MDFTSEDYKNIFKIFWNDDTTKVRVNIPECVLVEDGIVQVSLFTSKLGNILRKKSRKATVNAIRKRFLKSALRDSTNPSRTVCVVRRRESDPVLLSGQQFFTLTERLAHCERTHAPDHEMTFVIQEFKGSVDGHLYRAVVDRTRDRQGIDLEVLGQLESGMIIEHKSFLPMARGRDDREETGLDGSPKSSRSHSQPTSHSGSFEGEVMSMFEVSAPLSSARRIPTSATQRKGERLGSYASRGGMCMEELLEDGLEEEIERHLRERRERKSASSMSAMSVSRSPRIQPSSSQRPASGRRASRRPLSASSSSRFRSHAPRREDELSFSSSPRGRPMSASGAFRRSSGAASRSNGLSSRTPLTRPRLSSSQRSIASASLRHRRTDVEQFSPSPYPYSYSVMSHDSVSAHKRASGDRKSRNLMQLGTIESQMDELRRRMGIRVSRAGHFCPTEAVPVEPRKPQTMSKMMDSIHDVMEEVTILVDHVKFESEKVDQFRKRLRTAERTIQSREYDVLDVVQDLGVSLDHTLLEESASFKSILREALHRKISQIQEEIELQAGVGPNVAKPLEGGQEDDDSGRALRQEEMLMEDSHQDHSLGHRPLSQHAMVKESRHEWYQNEEREDSISEVCHADATSRKDAERDVIDANGESDSHDAHDSSEIAHTPKNVHALGPRESSLSPEDSMTRNVIEHVEDDEENEEEAVFFDNDDDDDDDQDDDQEEDQEDDQEDDQGGDDGGDRDLFREEHSMEGPIDFAKVLHQRRHSEVLDQSLQEAVFQESRGETWDRRRDEDQRLLEISPRSLDPSRASTSHSMPSRRPPRAVSSSGWLSKNRPVPVGTVPHSLHNLSPKSLVRRRAHTTPVVPIVASQVTEDLAESYRQLSSERDELEEMEWRIRQKAHMKGL
eukprot:TRINITY_DN1167_c1_g1_i4.p1 TRINITY_DN1167_c1_g1~~TRINITY_DN1167_c1_g1_i4.p1  ORF type:complete len:901 (+),score=236.55 TRINITY_DN1167_c1_g1_i4:159-2861(+)